MWRYSVEAFACEEAREYQDYCWLLSGGELFLMSTEWHRVLPHYPAKMLAVTGQNSRSELFARKTGSRGTLWGRNIWSAVEALWPWTLAQDHAWLVPWPGGPGGWSVAGCAALVYRSAWLRATLTGPTRGGPASDKWLLKWQPIVWAQLETVLPRLIIVICEDITVTGCLISTENGAMSSSIHTQRKDLFSLIPL